MNYSVNVVTVYPMPNAVVAMMRRNLQSGCISDLIISSLFSALDTRVCRVQLCEIHRNQDHLEAL